jgi:hypothetical protein
MREKSVLLTYQPGGSNQKGYRIHWRLASGGGLGSQKATSYYVQGKPGVITSDVLKPDTDYCFSLTAFNDNGVSQYSNEDCGKTKDTVERPTQFGITELQSHSIRFTFRDNDTKEIGYLLYWHVKGSKSMASTLFKRPEWTSTTGQREVFLTVSSQFSSDTRCYYVVAYNVAATSPASNEVCTSPGGAGGGTGGGGSNTDKTAQVVLIGQDVYQGPRPYAATWPAVGFVKGHLKKIKIMDWGLQSLWVHFLKPGKTTLECGNPSATVTLKDGETSTPAQLQEIFGTSQPKLPVTFIACITVSSQPGPDKVFTTITYTPE